MVALIAVSALLQPHLSASGIVAPSELASLTTNPQCGFHSLALSAQAGAAGDPRYTQANLTQDQDLPCNCRPRDLAIGLGLGMIPVAGLIRRRLSKPITL